ncbi:hypothetical protein EIP91_003875, partial [Steccherinum ochraceum]
MDSWSIGRYHYIFTAGLSSATAVDIVITTTLIYYLKRSRTGFSSMAVIINSITLHTVETGLITSVTTVAALICVMGIYSSQFGIPRIALRYQQTIRECALGNDALGGGSQGAAGPIGYPMPVLFPENLSNVGRGKRYTRQKHLDPHTSK